MVEVLSGVKLIADRDAVLVANRKRKRGFEPNSIQLWRDLSRRGGLMVDAGAYTGFYSILAALNGARVVAYEPNPDAAERMRDNISLNSASGITVRQVALSDREGVSPMYGKGPMSSAGGLVPGEEMIGSAVTCRLDDERLEGVVAIKIDVERSEIPLLMGSLQTIRDHRPHILIESLDGPSEVDAILHPLGYARAGLDAGMYHYCP